MIVCEQVIKVVGKFNYVGPKAFVYRPIEIEPL